MRLRPLLLSAAGAVAAAHVGGVLMAAPILRQAEVLALVLLLAYALLAGLPSPRWAMPVALAALVVDAVRTMPPDPADRRFWYVIRPGPPSDLTGELHEGLDLAWAALLVVLVLTLVAGRHAGRPSRRVLVGTALVAATVVGYVLLGMAEVHFATRDVHTSRTDDGWQCGR